MMRWIRARKRLAAFTLIEVMAVTGIMSTLQSQGGYRYAIDAANAVKGINNLRQVYQMLMMQSMTDGLPKAAFYPEGDPLKDKKSIVRLVTGAPKELFISPFAPEALKKKGLTFAWNDTANGKSLDLLPKDTWLMIDLAAFIADPDMRKPERYLVLYADGRAKAIKDLPPDILKAVEAVRKKIEEKKRKEEEEAAPPAEGAAA